MSTKRFFLSISLLTAVGFLACTPASDPAPMESAGNLITGEGLPNPAPTVVTNWGDLPEGREWGSTAGVDLDPIDGHIWAYERCGASSFGGGVPVNCESNPVPPVFKFDRNTGEVLANFGADLMVTPHGIHVDSEGNVWITDFAGNQEGTRGHQVWKFSPEGEVLLTLGMAGQPGNAPGQFNQPNDVVTGPDGSIYVSDGHNGQGMTTNQAMQAGLEAGQTARIQKFTPEGEFIMNGVRSGWSTVSSGLRTPWPSTHRIACGSQTVVTTGSRSTTRTGTISIRATATVESAGSSSPMTIWSMRSTPSRVRPTMPTGVTVSVSARSTKTVSWRSFRRSSERAVSTRARPVRALLSTLTEMCMPRRGPIH